MECSICLDCCVYPVQLPCKHIFCFLCVKGASNICKRCPICRKPIPEKYFDNPTLINSLHHIDITYNGSQWFYEGRNGWWLYDERTSEELDEAFKTGLPQCLLLIAGHLYIIDFSRMIQCRKNEPHRQRRIKRGDIKSIPTKGIAGIKIVSSTERILSGASPDQQNRTVQPMHLKSHTEKGRESDEDENHTNNERTNDRLDELASNFIRSLNLRRQDFQETYI